MPATERPKSRLDDGRVNPDYTAWRKANILDKPQLSGELDSSESHKLAPVGSIPTPATLILKGTKTTKNAMFVMATSPDEAGCSVPVRLLKKGSAAKFIKKDIKVERRDDQFFQIR